MKSFIFLIGSTNDFETLEDLKACYFSGDHDFSQYNASVFEFEVPENLNRGYALLIGCGLAFTNDWCMDDTFFTLLEA